MSSPHHQVARVMILPGFFFFPIFFNVPRCLDECWKASPASFRPRFRVSPIWVICLFLLFDVSKKEKESHFLSCPSGNVGIASKEAIDQVLWIERSRRIPGRERITHTRVSPLTRNDYYFIKLWSSPSYSQVVGIYTALKVLLAGRRRRSFHFLSA